MVVSTKLALLMRLQRGYGRPDSDNSHFCHGEAAWRLINPPSQGREIKMLVLLHQGALYRGCSHDLDPCCELHNRWSLPRELLNLRSLASWPEHLGDCII